MTPPNYIQPLDPDVAKAAALLDEADREAFEERAAIFEYDAGLCRREAERSALREVLAEQRLRNTRAR